LLFILGLVSALLQIYPIIVVQTVCGLCLKKGKRSKSLTWKLLNQPSLTWLYILCSKKENWSTSFLKIVMGFTWEVEFQGKNVKLSVSNDLNMLRHSFSKSFILTQILLNVLDMPFLKCMETCSSKYVNDVNQWDHFWGYLMSLKKQTAIVMQLVAGVTYVAKVFLTQLFILVKGRSIFNNLQLSL